jgi:hypothetical protein
VFGDNALNMQAQKKEKALSQVKNAILVFPEKKKEHLEALKEYGIKKAAIEGSDTGKLAELEHKEAEILNRIRLLEKDVKDSEKKLVVLREELESKKEKLLSSISLIDSRVK